jgi:hypothetical protein
MRVGEVDPDGIEWKILTRRGKLPPVNKLLFLFFMVAISSFIMEVVLPGFLPHATYQRVMTVVFYGLIPDRVEVYVDDIVVKSHDPDDHNAHLRELMIRAVAFFESQDEPLDWRLFGAGFGMEVLKWVALRLILLRWKPSKIFNL